MAAASTGFMKLIYETDSSLSTASNSGNLFLMATGLRSSPRKQCVD